MITRSEAMEVGDELFDEYLPKVSAKNRAQFLSALFAELQDRNALDIEEDEGEPTGVDNLFDDPEAY